MGAKKKKRGSGSGREQKRKKRNADWTKIEKVIFALKPIKRKSKRAGLGKREKLLNRRGDVNLIIEASRSLFVSALVPPPPAEYTPRTLAYIYIRAFGSSSAASSRISAPKSF